ncbi:helix-turn-helix domain-containing protein [Micromonospora echinospora]
MSRPRPVTQADYDRVKELHAQGLSRNAIAEQLGRSGKTISEIAKKLDLTFDRTRTRAATEAKKDDAAARRARLQVDALAGAQKLMGQMFSKAKIYNFGGKENDYNERDVDEPPFRDKRDIANAIQALANTALKLAEYDKATGNESEKSMLTDLREALINARKDAT